MSVVILCFFLFPSSSFSSFFLFVLSQKKRESDLGDLRVEKRRMKSSSSSFFFSRYLSNVFLLELTPLLSSFFLSFFSFYERFLNTTEPRSSP